MIDFDAPSCRHKENGFQSYEEWRIAAGARKSGKEKRGEIPISAFRSSSSSPTRVIVAVTNPPRYSVPISYLSRRRARFLRLVAPTPARCPLLTPCQVTGRFAPMREKCEREVSRKDALGAP